MNDESTIRVSRRVPEGVVSDFDEYAKEQYAGDNVVSPAIARALNVYMNRENNLESQVAEAWRLTSRINGGMTHPITGERIVDGEKVKRVEQAESTTFSKFSSMSSAEWRSLDKEQVTFFLRETVADQLETVAKNEYGNKTSEGRIVANAMLYEMGMTKLMDDVISKLDTMVPVVESSWDDIEPMNPEEGGFSAYEGPDARAKALLAVMKHTEKNVGKDFYTRKEVTSLAQYLWPDISRQTAYNYRDRALEHAYSTEAFYDHREAHRDDVREWMVTEEASYGKQENEYRRKYRLPSVCMGLQDGNVADFINEPRYYATTDTAASDIEQFLILLKDVEFTWFAPCHDRLFDISNPEEVNERTRVILANSVRETIDEDVLDVEGDWDSTPRERIEEILD